MPQIGHINPGGFLLICGLIVLAAGLMLLLLARRETLEPAYSAPVSLIQPAWYTPVSVYTALPTLLPASSIHANALASPPPDRVRIEPPVCYDMPHQALMCLGRVFNLGDTMVESVRLRVEMPVNGASAITQPEQQFIAPGGFAPYRVQFNHAVEERAALITSLESSHLRQHNSYTLAVMDQQGSIAELDSYGRYVVTATVLNPYFKAMQDVQIIATLANRNGDLTGYRVEKLNGGMSAGESRSLRLEIIPHTLEAIYTYHLTVLAWEDQAK